MADVLDIFRRLLITFTSRCRLGVLEGDTPLLVRRFSEADGFELLDYHLQQGRSTLAKEGYWCKLHIRECVAGVISRHRLVLVLFQSMNKC